MACWPTAAQTMAIGWLTERAPGLSPPLLILTLTLTLIPNPMAVTKPNPYPTDPSNTNQLITNPNLPLQLSFTGLLSDD